MVFTFAPSLTWSVTARKTAGSIDSTVARDGVKPKSCS